MLDPLSRQACAVLAGLACAALALGACRREAPAPMTTGNWHGNARRR